MSWVENRYRNITVDDTYLRQIVLYDLRRAIGLVSQDVFLFHGTVRENIAYGLVDSSSCTYKQLEAAGKIANCD